MKKIIAIFITIIVLMLPSIVVHAKSYSIDEVQIKGWLQPSGDMIVNELFTYTFDGDFTKVTRSFPDRHNRQIDDFEAHIISSKRPVVGEITGNMLNTVKVTTKGTTRTAEIDAKNKTISVLYVYTMRGAVKSYETYSDLDLTFFEKGVNHDADYKNVTISYVLPGDVGDSNVHGFMYDQNGKTKKVYRNGIVFGTPNSQAHSVTATRVFFPSFIMTEQQKEAAEISFEEAVEQEQNRLEAFQSKVSLTPKITTIVWGGSILFLIGAVFQFFVRQRWFAPFGNTAHVLQTDTVYLSFVEHNGDYHPKSFLAGIFSLAEKGHVDVELAPSAERFKRQPDAPEKTLAFQFKKMAQPLLPYEKTLVTWLFKVGLKTGKFHLHDIAGMADDEKDRKKSYLKTQYAFEKKHYEWHSDVKSLMVEAGTISNKLSNVLKQSVFVVIALLVAPAVYVTGGGGWGIAFPFIIVVLMIGVFTYNPWNKWLPAVFFIILFFVMQQMIIGDLFIAVALLLATGALLYFVIPSTLLTSLNALYTKMSIIKFRKQMRKGFPPDLTDEQQERWLTRAYLLNPSNKKLPKINSRLTQALPLTALFALEADPLDFVQSTWGPTRIVKASSGDGGYGQTYDSGGGGGGSGDGGGGGAGAD
ncbi:DUF2207 domain-containing protein [Sporosarcina sp. JAI121]|uniref:DUF2207 domain-containing protein n=1 Tax=Sporosarcina sp. JAI121 TaxID=2723064 RepID=UPI0015CAFB6E|nr:DUF2207 domain-containing protein [Sporosarcina sp. JAI121]NYF25644.1 putative membrane protein YgcG/predicted DNA binding protein [Sporosarcina sp. JAI121]